VASSTGQVFIARQPILDRVQHVYAYELLFRDSAEADSSGTQSEHASAKVITDAVLAFGLERLTRGRPAFINVTRNLLLEGIPSVLRPDRVVIELLEDIEGDEEVLRACRALRRAGYSIALDDFMLTDRTEPLVPLANFMKIDWLAGGDTISRRRTLGVATAHGLSLLAEKIETVEQYEAARGEGFGYFQGYFFGRPITRGAQRVPSDQIGYFRLLRALHDPNLSVQKIETLVQHDASLCFRVLRTVNSASFGQAREIDSIQQALVLMGIDVVRRWVSLWVLAGLNERAHPEIVDMASVRARCCELLAAQQTGADAAPGGFLLGMCSLLDSILAQPMESLLEQLPLPESTRAALRGDDTPSRRLLDCVIAYERGEWDRCLDLARRAGIDRDALVTAHKEAIRWSMDFLQASK
jgi:EAL and modified HD-GYP domain-containing signal transduction protein